MDCKERIVLVILIASVLLIGFKFWLAAVSGSLSLRASATHSVANAAILAFVLLGLFIARWEASRRRPGAGASRIENWVALAVAAASFYVGFDIVCEVLLGEPPELRNVGPVTLAALVTIPVAFVLFVIELTTGAATQLCRVVLRLAHVSGRLTPLAVLPSLLWFSFT